MKTRLAASLVLIVLASLTSLATAQVVPQKIRVSSGVMQGMVVKKVQPQYPGEAKAQKIQGQVVLKATIDKEGNVANLQLISGHPMLAPAAIEAVKQWKYRPYLLNGNPLEVETSVTVNFTLADAAPGEDVAADNPEGAQAASQHARVSQAVMAALVANKVQPEYPADARSQRIQGVVLLKAIIDKEGNVANLQLISGHPALAPAAIEAVKQWKYRPYQLNGEPVEVETTVTVNFTLVD